jgi:hypothetical protein
VSGAAAPWAPSTRSPGPSRATLIWPSPAPATAPSASTSSTSPRTAQADRHRQLDLCGRLPARPDRHGRPDTSPVTVNDWAATHYQQQCARVFDTYMRDIDISPDGSYFVVGTTGPTGPAACATPPAGRPAPPAAASSRPGSTPPAVTPSTAWPSPGPRCTSAATQRWMNNNFVADRAGPGAVAREGIAALDPMNGLPCPGTPAATAAWARSPSSPPARACGSAATPTASAATSTTAPSPSYPWPAAPRS